MVSRDNLFYYNQELRYLHQEGQRFAEKHPDIARQLGLDGVNAELRDPHSERILEGFAFLTGKLRKMVDRQYPELAHALFNLIFPSYLRPVPSKTICQFHAQEGMLDKPQLIPRGTEVRGQLEQEEIIFTTAHALQVQPIELKKFYVDPETSSDFSISAVLELHNGVDPLVLDYDQIEFFIQGEPSVRFELFQQMNAQLKGIAIKGIQLPEGSFELEWTGFKDEHSFHPDDEASYLPLYLLRDYFDHPDRFMFFRVKGLSDALAPLMDELNSFQIDFSFHKPFSSGSLFKTSNLLLHACSCQNVFTRTAEPILFNGNQLEYRIIPDISQPEQEVYAIRKILLSKERKQQEVQPYYCFDQASKNHPDHFFYAIRREPSEHGGWETFLRIFQLNQESPSKIRDYLGSILIFATQGNRARKIKVGQVQDLDRAIPETIQVKNVTQATAPSWPSLYSKSDWNFISHLALNYLDIQEIKSLKELLTLYNFSQSETIARKINGIQALHKKRDYRIECGSVLNGFALTVACDEGKYQHTGDLVLFGRVLGQFMKAFCPFNSFIRLALEIGHHEKILESIVKG